MEKKRMRSSYFYCFGEIEYSSSRLSSSVKTRSSILMARGAAVKSPSSGESSASPWWSSS
ncbi:unnamed protein product, partial [Arabidopsis halleri]